MSRNATKGLPIEDVVRLEIRPNEGSKRADHPHFLRIVAANHEPGFLGEGSKTRAESRALGERWSEILSLPLWEFDHHGKRTK